MAGTRSKATTTASTTDKRASTKNRKKGPNNITSTNDTQTDSLQRANDELRAQVQALEAEASRLKTTLEKDNETLRAQLVDLEKTTQPQETILAIPRPKGNSYNLQKKMGLEDDTMKYDEIRAVWKRLIRVAAFEDGATFSNQPKEKIVKFAKKARVMVPFLRRFKADWATETYLRRSLRNRKGYVKHKLAKRVAAGIDASDNGLDDNDRGSLGDNEVGSLGGSNC